MEDNNPEEGYFLVCHVFPVHAKMQQVTTLLPPDQSALHVFATHSDLRYGLDIAEAGRLHILSRGP